MYKAIAYFSQPIFKVIVDLLLVGLLFFCFDSSHSFEHDAPRTNVWSSTHCIAGVTMVVMMLTHIGQHWHFAVALLRKSVMLKNKITLLSLIVFLAMSTSIAAMISASDTMFKIHHLCGNPFILVMLIHTAMKTPAFIRICCFRRKKTTEQPPT